VLEGLEKDAREAGRGLWADPQPVPPWEWRKTLLPKGK
jgi:endonuclease YncB( thermonuclease family)